MAYYQWGRALSTLCDMTSTALRANMSIPTNFTQLLCLCESWHIISSKIKWEIPPCLLSIGWNWNYLHKWLIWKTPVGEQHLMVTNNHPNFVHVMHTRHVIYNYCRNQIADANPIIKKKKNRASWHFGWNLVHLVFSTIFFLLFSI